MISGHDNFVDKHRSPKIKSAKDSLHNREYSPDRALRLLRQIQQHKVRAGSRDYYGVSRLTPVQMQLSQVPHFTRDFSLFP